MAKVPGNPDCRGRQWLHELNHQSSILSTFALGSPELVLRARGNGINTQRAHRRGLTLYWFKWQTQWTVDIIANNPRDLQFSEPILLLCRKVTYYETFGSHYSPYSPVSFLCLFHECYHGRCTIIRHISSHKPDLYVLVYNDLPIVRLILHILTLSVLTDIIRDMSIHSGYVSAVYVCHTVYRRHRHVLWHRDSWLVV